jgi:hypothetical protein
MVKSWNEFLEDLGDADKFLEDLGNPLNDLDKNIVSMTNKLMLMQPEEVQQWRHKLTELRNLIDRVLNSQP